MNTTSGINKIGSLGALIAHKVPSMTRSEFLQFLYFLEQSSKKLLGKESFHIGFEMVDGLPTSIPLTLMLVEGHPVLDQYFQFEPDEEGLTRIKQRGPFNLSLFTAGERRLIFCILSKYRMLKLTRMEYLFELAERLFKNRVKLAS